MLIKAYSPEQKQQDQVFQNLIEYLLITLTLSFFLSGFKMMAYSVGNTVIRHEWLILIRRKGLHFRISEELK